MSTLFPKRPKHLKTYITKDEFSTRNHRKWKRWFQPITIIFNNKKHIIKFDIDSKRILFTVVRIEKNKKSQYFVHQSKLETLRQNSKILHLYPSTEELIELFDKLFKNQKIYLDYNNYPSYLNENETTNNEISETYYSKTFNKELFLIIKLNIWMKEEILLLPLEKRNEVNEKIINLNEDEEEKEENVKEIEELSSNYIQLKQKY